MDPHIAKRAGYGSVYYIYGSATPLATLPGNVIDRQSLYQVHCSGGKEEERSSVELLTYSKTPG